MTQFGFVSPALIGVPLSTEVLIWTALGGREVLLAAFLGALLVRSVESALSDALGYYWLLALGVLFVASVVIFPRGLLGRVLWLPLPARLGKDADHPDATAGRCSGRITPHPQERTNRNHSELRVAAQASRNHAATSATSADCVASTASSSRRGSLRESRCASDSICRQSRARGWP